MKFFPRLRSLTEAQRKEVLRLYGEAHEAHKIGADDEAQSLADQAHELLTSREDEQQ